jgi:hypothetical protein
MTVSGKAAEAHGKWLMQFAMDGRLDRELLWNCIFLVRRLGSAVPNRNAKHFLPRGRLYLRLSEHDEY